MSWLIPRNALTVDQSRAVELSPMQHRLVLGSPGSGKTIVLIHRARHLIDSGKATPERCRLFVYTNALVAYIRSALRDVGLPDDCVMTFDAWCCDFYEQRIAKRLPYRRQRIDWEAVRQAVWQRTHLLKAVDHIFDFVMVDEGQDLDRRDFETLTAVAKHVTVFMDPKQKLYERDAEELGVAAVLGLPRRNSILLEAFRCSPFIVQAGAAFIRDEVERRQFIAQNPPIEKGERQSPLLYLASDESDELAHLIEVIRTRIDRNERIAILLPTVHLTYVYAYALRDAGLEVEVNQTPHRRAVDLPDIDFASGSPKLMAFPSSKGLTFDTVLMPRWDKKAIPRFATKRLERWLFVGITRATRWIYLSTTDGEETLFLRQFRELQQREQMTIQLSKIPPAEENVQPVAKTAPKDEVDRREEEEDLSELF